MRRWSLGIVLMCIALVGVSALVSAAPGKPAQKPGKSPSPVVTVTVTATVTPTPAPSGEPSPSTSPSPENPKWLKPGWEAYNKLRFLRAMLQGPTPYATFSEKLAECHGVVDLFLEDYAGDAHPTVRMQMAAALNKYDMAQEYWQYCISTGTAANTTQDPTFNRITLMYPDLKDEVKRLGGYNFIDGYATQSVVRALWVFAADDMKRLDEVMRQFPREQ